MNIPSSFKKLIIAGSLLLVTVCAFLVHALAGLTSQAVVFQEPPDFVGSCSAKFTSKVNAATTGAITQPDSQKLTEYYPEETALLHRVFFEDQYDSLSKVLQLFSHPDKAQRIRIAAAFGDNEQLSNALLATGHLDPAYQVRKQSLHSRYKRFTGQI